MILARLIWPEVDKLRGDQGARGLFAAHPEWLVEIPVEGGPAADIDTWDDYQGAVAATPAKTARSKPGRTHTRHASD